LVCIALTLTQSPRSKTLEMKAEENIVDEWIKQSVRREILYRLVVWCLITIIVLCISSNSPSFTLEKYVIPFTSKMFDQLNFIWAFLYFFIAISFFFKDMAYMKKDRWGNHSNRHILGMLLKKITGELLLWSAGIATSLATIVVICFPLILLSDHKTHFSSYFLTAVIIAFTFLFTSMIIFFYYHLRIDRPAIFYMTNSPILTKIIYLLLFLGCGAMSIWIGAK
jgi:hypothetical protein